MSIKTKVNDANVKDFLNQTDESKREDAFTLLGLFQKVTGEPPKMWGGSIVGFGVYHYKSERSAQEGDWPLVAFSPRKQNLTLYIMTSLNPKDDLFSHLGKHKTSVGCLYINKLADVDIRILEKLITASFAGAKKRYNQ